MTENDNRRPYPPVNFTGENWLPYTRLIPATEIGEWVNQNILSEEGRIHNPDHAHLVDADVAFMWASGSFSKSGRIVLGQCEQVMMLAGGWQKSRMEQQMHEWFGRIPKFIITPLLTTVSNATIWSSAHWLSMSFTTSPVLPMTMARRNSTKRPVCRCSNFATTTSRNSSELSGVTAPAKTCRKWWMRRTGRRRLLISMLPELAGRAC